MRRLTPLFLPFAGIVLSLSLCAMPPDPLFRLVMAGRQLSADKAAILERNLSSNPTDTESRAGLLGFYFP